VVDGLLGGSAPPGAAPQWPQYRLAGALALPQAAQARASAAPQALQNRPSCVLAPPQDGQSMTAISNPRSQSPMRECPA
jgi:hypothetical protein